MELGDVSVAYIMFISGNGGKRRPIFVISEDAKSVSFYPITSKYQKKSLAIKKNYFKINDLKVARLKKDSWIDTGNLIQTAKPFLKSIVTIGHLSKSDLHRLAQFVQQR